MSEIELKACPFCGAKPVMLVRGGDERNGYNTNLTFECLCGVSIETETQNNGGLPTETVAAAKRRLRAAWNTRAPQWQPIESAPKDGTAVLATSAHMTGPNGEPVAWAAVFDQERGRWTATWDGEPLNDATHWQPLPAPLEVSA